MSQQIQISGGAKVRDLQDVIIGTSGVLSSLAFNVANGVPKLDVNGKILVSQLPNSVMEYLGTWNAATNTPTLANGTGNQGDVWLCTTPGTVNFGAGPITFIVGDSAIYSGSIWQRSGGATGSVTSVGLSTNGGAITIGSSPVTTSGTITANFNGTNLQYVNGAGNLTTFPTLITSIGLSMPSAFSVANSPLTANGTIAVTGAGTTAQYIRGDGSLATFPTIATDAQRLITEVYNETGATLSKGTVVYINGGHGNLPTITKALATGDATSAQTYGVVQNDITDNNNGYVVVLGSLGDLDTQAYPNGTQLYLSSTTAGAWTSTKQYAPAHLVYVAIVTRSHPTQGVVEVMIQNGFEMDELHNVSAQSPLNNQGLFYNTSTSLWENKSIATALGYTPADDSLVVKLAGTQTITGAKTFSGAVTFTSSLTTTSNVTFSNSGFTLVLQPPTLSVNRTVTLPDATGTLALTSDLTPYALNSEVVKLTGNQTIAGLKTFSVYTTHEQGALIKHGINLLQAGYTGIGASTLGLVIGLAGGGLASLNFNNTTSYTYTFPNATGTIALTSDLTGGTVTSVAALTIGTSGTDLSSTVANSTTTPVITLNVPTASATNRGALSSADWTTFNNKQNALTNPVLASGTWTSGYLPKINGTYTIGNSVIQESSSLIGINVTPTRVLHLSSSGTNAAIRLDNTTSGRPFLLTYDDSQNLTFINSSDSGYIAFNSGTGTSTTKMLLTNLGNLGLGVTPSAWNTNYKAYQVSNNGVVAAASIYNDLIVGSNLFYNAANSPRYMVSDYASMLYQYQGSFTFYTAPSGTAGNAITFTQAMTLTASGRLLINTPTESTYQLDVNGTGRFSGVVAIRYDEGTSPDAQLRLRGTNATARTTRIQLEDYAGAYADAFIDFKIPTAGVGSSATLSIGINVPNLTFASTGAATFSSSVTAGGLVTASAKLEVNDTNGIPIRFQDITAAISGQTAGYIGMSTSAFSGNNGDLVFYPRTSATSRILLMGGNVGIGETSPASKLSIGGVQGSTIGSNVALLVGNNGAAGSVGNLIQIGLHYNPAGATPASVIGAVFTSTTGYTKSDIFFATRDVTTDTAPTERMRITSGGALCLGVTSAYGTNLLNVNGGIYATSSIAAVVAADLDMMVFQNTGATYSKACVVASMTATGGTGSYFFYGQQSTSTAAIKIFSNGNIQNTNNSYGAISDARLKENIKDATPKLDDLMKVKVRNYNLKGESNKQLGVISQELEAIFPNMIEESTNMGENMKIKGVKYSVFVPMLIKAVQEQQQQINELKQLLNK